MDAAFSRCYSLHGLDLIVQCEDKALADVSDLLFTFLPFEKSERSDTHFHISIKFAFSEKPAPIPRDSLKPYIVNDISIFDTKKSVDITDGYSTFRIEPWAGLGIVSIHPSFKKKTLASKYNFFLLGLTYLFSYQGLFDFHGAALDNHEIGYVLLGESNSGKSSMALSLVHQGWRYASDDSLLLKCKGNGVEVLSFRKNFYIDPEVASKYPEINSLFSNENDMVGCKRFLDLDQIYPNQFQPSIVPKVLIFSKITPDKKSTLQSVTKGQALSNLLKQSISIFFNRQVVNEHLNVLKRLVHQTDCYQLLAGRDLYNEPGEILKILPCNHYVEMQILEKIDQDLMEG
jgi:hypothetical protein